MSLKTLVIGASENETRYSAQAIKLLQSYGHEVYAIGGRKGEVHGITFGNELINLNEIHTVTIYINPKIQELYHEYLLELKPKRVIFNPGSENSTLMKLLASHKILVETACTLVMLRTNQFDPQPV